MSELLECILTALGKLFHIVYPIKCPANFEELDENCCTLAKKVAY